MQAAPTEDNKSADADDAKSAAAAAEALRRQGNDAFSTKDWGRAAELYRRSVTVHESAKAYSNLAASLCKLLRYEEASEAADRATSLEPGWGKAWWRRGVAAELLKFFPEALKYYSIAADVDPGEKAFRVARDKIRARLGATEEEPAVIECKGAFKLAPDRSAPPYYRAWTLFCDHCLSPSGADDSSSSSSGILDEDAFVKWFLQQKRQGYPTSRQYLVFGLWQWTTGMKSAVARLALATSPQANAAYRALRERTPATDEAALRRETEPLLGGIPETPIDGLFSGFGLLLGKHLSIENGPGRIEHSRHQFCPPPACLWNVNGFQLLAVLHGITALCVDLKNTFGGGMKCSKGLLDAVATFASNVGRNKDEFDIGVEASPAEAVQYMKQQLDSGRISWESGLRKYVAVQYRATILYGGLLRLLSQISHCYQFEKWAFEFIGLADEEFRVGEDRSYEEKGDVFRMSARIGFTVSFMMTQSVLRAHQVFGPYPLSEAIDLALCIVKMAKKVSVTDGTDPFIRAQMVRVSKKAAIEHCRPPMSLTHAHTLSFMRTNHFTLRTTLLHTHRM